MRKLFALLGLLILFTGCHHHDDEPEVNGKEPGEIIEDEKDFDRTVLVYMSGENNLADVLTDDLEELTEGSKNLTARQRLIAFVDTTGTTKPYLVEIAGGKRTVVKQFDSDFYASDPAKFREIVQWTMNAYDSEEYAMILWGHASGWTISKDTLPSVQVGKARTYVLKAYGQDKGSDTGGSEKWINITQMAQALKGLPKLKYIFADCCNFMCVESAYELRDCADYLIGSPAEIPGEGGPYEELTPTLFSKEKFCKEIIDTYYNYFLEAYKTTYQISYLKDFSVPLSAIDLSKMTALAEATSKVMTTIVPKYPNEIDLSNTLYYFKDGMMKDMQAVIKNHASASDYTTWKKVFDEAVVYKRMSRKWMTIYSELVREFSNFAADESLYGSVSMFFPQTKYMLSTKDYNKQIQQFEWSTAVGWQDYGWY